MQSTIVNSPKPSRLGTRDRHFFHWIIGVMVLLSLPSATLAVSRIWTGSASADWSIASNWNPAGVPSELDTVTIANGASVNLTQNVTVGGFNLDGWLTGTNRVTVTGTMNWTGGTLGSEVTIPVGASLNISGGAGKGIDGGIVNNQGTAVWSGAGNIAGARGGQINNRGLFEVRNDALANWVVAGANARFENLAGGTFRKLASAGRTGFAPFLFNNHGLVEILSGTLALTSGGMSSGTFSNAANTSLEFAGGTMVLQQGATFALRGKAQVHTSATLTLVGTNLLHAGGALELAVGGTLNGIGTFTGPGTFIWSGGSLEGTVNISPGTQMEISGAGGKSLSGGIVNNQGTAVWKDTGGIYGRDGQINNHNQGLFEVRNDALAYWDIAGAKATFENRPGGTFRKLASAGRTVFFPFLFNNHGLVEVLSGTLSLGSGGTSSGTFSNAANATLEFTGGTMALQQGATFALRGKAQVHTSATLTLIQTGTNLLHAGGAFELAGGGILNGTGTFTGPGTFIWSGGNLEGTVNIPPSTRMEISGAGAKAINGGILNNQGTVIWSGTGPIGGDRGGRINNRGLFEVRNDATAYAGNNATFHNLPDGVFRKTSSGETSFSSFILRNEGLLSIQGGKLSLSHFVFPDGTMGNRTIVGVPPPPPFGGFGYTTTVVPIRSSNPWQFTAVQSSLVSDLRVRVQSSVTPEDEESWEFLPGFATRLASNWTLNTIDVPAGARYFRAIATAPGYADTVTDRLAMIGPITVLDGIAPYGDFSYETSSPLRTGTEWKFIIVQPSLVSDLRLRVQSNADGQNPNTWSDLPGGGRMGRVDSKWTHITSDLPLGTNFFRVIATVPTYADRVSAVLGPFDIGLPLPKVEVPRSSGTYSLQSINEVQDPVEVYVRAVTDAQVFLILDHTQFLHLLAKAAITLAAAQNAAARLTIEVGRSLTVPGLNIGQNTALILKGVIKGDVRLIGLDGASMIGNAGNTLIGNAGNTLIGNDSGTLQIIAPIIPGGGGNVIATDGASLISTDSASIIATDSASLIGLDGGSFRLLNASTGGKSALQGLKTAPAPAFTGVMTVDGNYAQGRGAGLAIAIAGTNILSAGAQEYDQLRVSGRADLAGTIGFALFNSRNATDQTNIFQPPAGAMFDVVVAKNIVVHDLIVRGPIWGDGLHFKWGLVNRADGNQALRLLAVHIKPPLVIRPAGGKLEVAYPTNFTGYALQRSATLTAPNWTPLSNGTNRVKIDTAGSTGFFRMLKQ